MQLPSGLLKFSVKTQALIRQQFNRASNSSRQIPSRGKVGISHAFIPSDSIICKMPKKVGDSIAMASPGLATARKQRCNASVAPQVITMSSGESMHPASSARRATCTRRPVLPGAGS